MACDIPDSPRKRSCDFRPIVAALLAQTGLPFATILSAEKIERVFAKHGGLFGGNGIYTTAVMVWSFLAQVLRDGKEASCQAAVARVVSFCEQQGIAAPTADPSWREINADARDLLISNLEKRSLRIFRGPEHTEYEPCVVGEVRPHEESRVLIMATKFAKKLVANAICSSLFRLETLGFV